MNWLDLLFGRKSDPVDDDKYLIANLLYSEDARRCVEIRRLASGTAYIVERDLGDDGAYVDRHGGAMVGPFESTERAELFIIGTPWFRGDESEAT